MLRIDIDIELTLAGPFITKSTAPGEYGIDAVVARNADGEVYIAGSHIVGKLRESWEDLENALGNTTNNLLIPDQNKIKELLGKIVDRNGDMSPGTKRLYFSDFLLDSRHEDMNPRYRIRLDEKRGAVQEGAQMLIESPFAAGEDVCFRGVTDPQPGALRPAMGSADRCHAKHRFRKTDQSEDRGYPESRLFSKEKNLCHNHGL
jgi:hypothetical protein